MRDVRVRLVHPYLHLRVHHAPVAPQHTILDMLVWPTPVTPLFESFDGGRVVLVAFATTMEDHVIALATSSKSSLTLALVQSMIFGSSFVARVGAACTYSWSRQRKGCVGGPLSRPAATPEPRGADRSSPPKPGRCPTSLPLRGRKGVSDQSLIRRLSRFCFARIRRCRLADGKSENRGKSLIRRFA